MSDTVTTYEPDNSLKKGYRSILQEIFAEFKNNRWLIYQLFKRDFVTVYRQSVIGILWAFIIPIVSVATFIVLNQSGLFNVGNVAVNYTVFALLGLAYWQLFSSGILYSSASLTSAGAMITKINLSKKALVVASLGKTMVAFLIQFVLALASFAFFGVLPNPMILLTPIFVIPLLLATLGLGFLLALLSVVIRDFVSALPLATTFLLFLTPVMYAMPKVGLLALVTKYNPLYYLVSVPRDLALTGTSAGWMGFLISSALSIVIFVACLIAFHLTETRLAERL